jgi:hypothetical protein
LAGGGVESLCGLAYGPVAGSCEHCNEPLVSGATELVT